jgi:ketosteroid isomerase-like protein
MQSERVRIARNAYDAWNRGDFETMVESTAPDIEWQTARAFPGVESSYRGRAGIRSFWDTMRDAWEFMNIDAIRITEHGDRLLVELHFDAKGRESGVEVEMDFVQVLTFRGEQVVRLAGYRGLEDARAAEGIPTHD